jgi:hypothetical protein
MYNNFSKNRLHGMARLAKSNRALLARRVLFSTLSNTPRLLPPLGYEEGRRCRNCGTDAGTFNVRVYRRTKGRAPQCAACGFGWG